MKKIIILIAVLTISFSCKKELKSSSINSFYITGHIDSIFENTKVFLKIQENKTIILLDSTQIINGSFIFSGNNNNPSVFGIYIDSLKSSIGFFIENDSVTIDVNKDNISESKVSGSKLNDQYLEYIKKSNQILSKTNYLFPIFQKARAENDVDKLNEIYEKMKVINNENTQFALNYAKEHRNSYIAAFALHSILNDYSTSKDSIFNVYNNFSENVKKGDFAIEILVFIESKSILDNIKN